MSDEKPNATGTPTPPKPPARPGSFKAKPRVRKMAKPPEPAPEHDPPPKRAPRQPTRTKVAGWEKGTVRTACFYVQDSFHQAVNVAASTLRTSKGIVVERAVMAFLKDHPDLEGVRPALAAILGEAWTEGEGDGEG